MKITRTSPFSNKKNTMDLPITQYEYDRWEKGEMIQNVWPNLTADEREFIMTGITSEEWDKMFKGDEEC